MTIRAAVALVMALALGTSGAATAQPAALTRPSAGVLPRITVPATPATARINAALARLDHHWAGYVKDCLAGGKDNEASRRVEIPMRGPRYLALLARDNEDCGGAHPDYSLMALTYDLSTGRPVDWAKLLGPKLAGSVSTDSVIDGTTIGLVSSPALRALYVRTLKASGGEPADWWKDCSDALSDNDLKFSVWPDAKAHGLVLAPEMDHSDQACGDEVPVKPAAMRGMGVSPELLAALGG